jgi:hypothetical protein
MAINAELIRNTFLATLTCNCNCLVDGQGDDDLSDLRSHITPHWEGIHQGNAVTFRAAEAQFMADCLPHSTNALLYITCLTFAMPRQATEAPCMATSWQDKRCMNRPMPWRELALQDATGGKFVCRAGYTRVVRVYKNGCHLCAVLHPANRSSPHTLIKRSHGC